MIDNEKLRMDMILHLKALRDKYKSETQATCISELYANKMLELIMEEAKYKEKYRVLDMGCGYSTVVLKHFAKTEPKVEVFGIDTQRAWLDKSIEFMEIYFGLDGNNLYTIEEFNQIKNGEPFKLDPFNFISFDIDYTKDRLKHLPMALGLLASDGVMMFDDMHKRHLRNPLRKRLVEKYKFDEVDPEGILEATMDEYRRYAWVITNIVEK